MKKIFKWVGIVLGGLVGLVVLAAIAIYARSGTLDPAAPMLLVDEAAGVTVAKLTIDGSAADGCASTITGCTGIPMYLGLYFRNSSGSLSRVSAR